MEENIALKYTDMNHVNSDLRRQLINEPLVVEEGKDAPKSGGDSKTAPAPAAPAKQ